MRDPLPESGDHPELIRIVAVGAPVGDDAAGLVLGARLLTDPPPQCEVRVRVRPGLGLLDDFDGAGAVLVVDAVRSGAAPGTLVAFDLLAAPTARPRGKASSHGIGVADAIALGRALDRLPSRLDFLGIEVGSVVPEQAPGAAVRQALDAAEVRVRAWVRAVSAARGRSVAES